MDSAVARAVRDAALDPPSHLGAPEADRELADRLRLRHLLRDVLAPLLDLGAAAGDEHPRDPGQRVAREQRDPEGCVDHDVERPLDR